MNECASSAIESSASQSQESSWISASQNGDTQAFNRLVLRWERNIYNAALRMLQDREEAAEAAQEIFLLAFKSIRSFRRDSKFSTWLYTIARNYCLSCVKARASAPEPASLIGDIPDADADDSLARLEKEGSASALRRLMRESLSETEFRVVSLHYIEELPLDAITRLLGLSNTSGAKAYIVSARRKLQQAAHGADVCSRRSGSAAYGQA